MTIRRRLIYSYLATFIIPLVMTAFMVLSCFGGLFMYIRSGNHIMAESAFQFINMSQVIHGVVFHYLRHGQGPEAFSWIVEMADPKQNYIIVDKNGVPVYEYGNKNLLPAVLAMREESVLKGVDASPERGVYSRTEKDEYYFLGKQTIRGMDWHLYFVSYRLPGGSDEAFENALHGMGYFLLITFVLFVGLTIRFLSKFIIRHIMYPVTDLKKGAERIMDGDLDTPITSRTGDEFQPVIDVFNRMSEELKGMLVQKERDKEKKMELIASISHDIRTPITAIKAYSEGLMDKVADTPEKQKRYLEIIHKKTQILDSLVEELFLLSKIDSGNQAIDMEVLDLGRKVNEIIKENRSDWENKGAVFHIAIEENVEIRGNNLLLHRVLSNLVANSLAYKKRITVNIKISVIRKEERVELQMTDDGPGVPEESLARLTEAFYRTDKARSNVENGSGLGLAIVDGAISLMEGNISIQNGIPAGLSVTMTFPLYKNGKRENI